MALDICLCATSWLGHQVRAKTYELIRGAMPCSLVEAHKHLLQNQSYQCESSCGRTGKMWPRYSLGRKSSSAMPPLPHPESLQHELSSPNVDLGFATATLMIECIDKDCLRGDPSQLFPLVQQELQSYRDHQTAQHGGSATTRGCRGALADIHAHDRLANQAKMCSFRLCTCVGSQVVCQAHYTIGDASHWPRCK